MCNHFWQNKPYLCSIFQNQFCSCNFSQLYPSCKHCDNSELSSTLRLTTPCYSSKVFQTSHLKPCLSSTGLHAVFILCAKLNSISSYNQWRTWSSSCSEGSLFSFRGRETVSSKWKHSLTTSTFLLLQKGNYSNTHIRWKKSYILNQTSFSVTFTMD